MNTMPKQNSGHKDINDLYRSDLTFCNYNTTNFQNSIKFYTEGLGLDPSDFSKKNPIPETDGVFEFNLPVKGAILSLSYLPKEKFKAYDNLVISVSDIEKFKEMLTSKNIESSKITDVPNLLSFLTVKDPDNNIIMFIADPK